MSTLTLDWRMRRLHAVGTHVYVEDNLAAGVGHYQTVSSDYTLYGSGPVTIDSYDAGSGVTVVDKTRAATHVSGHFGWIHFNDSRLRLAAPDELDGEWEFQQS